MSCTCQVIRGGFSYFPYVSEGGDPHLEDEVWNKEVITITIMSFTTTSVGEGGPEGDDKP